MALSVPLRDISFTTVPLRLTMFVVNIAAFTQARINLPFRTLAI